ncbi:MAG TPA: hypothetical protein VMR81_08440, partial [Patescibacteria group bacterium]|nr:hypothetical protein [Patescibacteria group bacterium]
MTIKYKNLNDMPRTAGQVFLMPSKTQQHLSNDADINAIVARFRKTGFLSNVNPRSPRFADVSLIGDFRTTQDRIFSIQNEFASLPSSIRTRFNNDVAELIDFIADKNNTQEAIELGIIPKPVQPGAIVSPAPVAPIPPAE